MKRIRLIHSNPAEAKERTASLNAAGYSVDFESISPAVLRGLKHNPPAAVVIDLSRQPSLGRDLALTLRLSKATRNIPLIFVEGDPDKAAAVRKLLPDAVYTTWSRIRSSLKRAIAHPPDNPVVPRSAMAGYAGAPLTKKLGIKANSVVLLVNAPQTFEKTLGQLPDGATLRRRTAARPGLTIWFTKSRKDLQRRIQHMVPLADKAGLWIAWPKRTSQIPTDLSQTLVRKIGLAAGLVDYKIAAIDATWSALLFTKRKCS
ncbi:MAG: PleD family two-component system response regulator [Planctomycetota bacterium]|jgi:CheY-like chemotaxis protein